MKASEFKEKWSGLFEDVPEERPTFILETQSRQDGPKLSGILKDALGSNFRIQPLFGDTPQPDNDRTPDLGRFWEISLLSRPFDAWSESPWDMAYDLQDMTDARSVEPDIPSNLFDNSPVAILSGCNAPDADDPCDPIWALYAINAPAAWDELARNGCSTGEGILIGQPDTGVADHDDLKGALDTDRGWNFVEGGASPEDPLKTNSLHNNVGLRSHGHGTATSSVVAGRRHSSVQGSTKHAKVVPIRAIRTVIRLTQKNVARAVEHARKNGCHVVSMSLGGLPLKALYSAIAVAIENQVIVVSAAGNCVGFVVYPARYQAVISVGGSNIRDIPWRGSSRGSRVDVTAPAEFVWRALRERPGECTNLAAGGQGTSYATALTAGVAALWLNDRRDALIRSLGLGESIQERFRYCLKTTARIPSAGWDQKKYGTGIVDAEKLVTTGCGLAPVPSPKPSAPAQEGYSTQIEGFLEEPDYRDREPAGVLLDRTRQLSESDKERFGHEIVSLVLMSRAPRFLGMKLSNRLQSVTGITHI